MVISKLDKLRFSFLTARPEQHPQQLNDDTNQYLLRYQHPVGNRRHTGVHPMTIYHELKSLFSLQKISSCLI